MQRAQNANKVATAALEAAAMKLLDHELEDFVQISKSLAKSFGFLQSRLKSPFPKDCRKCGKLYESFEDFFYGTDEIQNGTVSYPTLGKDFYLHRNCKSPCESTLVVVFTDRRDETPLGFKRRKKFQECLDKLQQNLPLPADEAREFLFTLLSNRIEQGETKNVAVTVPPEAKDTVIQLVDESTAPASQTRKKRGRSSKGAKKKSA